MDLQPAMSIKAQLAHIKQVPAGFQVSYGHTHTTQKETVIGTVPVGYADGYDRLLSSPNSMGSPGGTMLIRGKTGSRSGPGLHGPDHDRP